MRWFASSSAIPAAKWKKKKTVPGERSERRVY
jgi:hypothetical protein